MSKEFNDCQASTDESSAALLQVPHVQFSAQRSRSVESGSIDSSIASYLEVPKRFQRRRSSNTKSPLVCVHCQCVEEYERWLEAGGESPSYRTNLFGESDTSISDDDDDDTDESENIEKSFTDKQHLTIPLIVPHCNINISLSPTDSFPLQSSSVAHNDDTTTATSPITATNCDITTAASNIDCDLSMQEPPLRARRRSISRQEAIFIEPTGSSLENLDSMKTTETDNRKTKNNEKLLLGSNDSSDYVQDFYLTVPEADLRRDRAASVDSSFSKLSSNGKTEELTPQIDGFLAVPTNAVRSRSVDIVLPTNEQARYKALSLAAPTISKRYVKQKI